MEQDTNIEGNHHSQLAYPAHQSSNHRENWMTVSNPLTRAPFLGDEVWIRESKYKQRQIIDDNTISPPTKHKQEDGFETGAEPITREPTDLHKRFGNQHTMTKHELGMVLGLLVHQRELLNRRSNSNSSGEDPRLHPLPPPRTKERIQKLQQSSSRRGEDRREGDRLRCTGKAIEDKTKSHHILSPRVNETSTNTLRSRGLWINTRTRLRNPSEVPQM